MTPESLDKAQRKYEQDLARLRAKTAAWLAAGLCTSCGGPRDGKAQRCARCRAMAADAQRRRYRERLTAGLCTYCGAPRENPDHRLCEACNNVVKFKMRQRAAERRASGVCYICGKAKTPGTTRCPECNARRGSQAAERLASLHALGLCTRCGKAPALAGHTTCAACLAAIRRHDEERRREGTK